MLTLPPAQVANGRWLTRLVCRRSLRSRSRYCPQALFLPAHRLAVLLELPRVAPSWLRRAVRLGRGQSPFRHPSSLSRALAWHVDHGASQC